MKVFKRLADEYGNEFLTGFCITIAYSGHVSYRHAETMAEAQAIKSKYGRRAAKIEVCPIEQGPIFYDHYFPDQSPEERYGKKVVA